MEVRPACEVSTVNDRADVCPLRVHRTGCVNDEGQFDLATTRVVPSDLDVVVGINDDIWVSLVSDDWGEEGVVKERDHSTGSNVWLDHGVVDLWLVEETSQLIIVVLPHNVNVVLAVNIEGGPVTVLGSARDDGVVDGRDGAVIGCHAVHRGGPRRDGRVHDGVLAGFVSPHDVNAIVLVNGKIRMPNFVKSRIGNLGCVNERLPSWRHH